MRINKNSYFPLTLENDLEYTFVSQREEEDVKEKIVFKHKFRNVYELELLVYIERLNVYAVNTTYTNKNTDKIFHTLFVGMVLFSTRTKNNIWIAGYSPVHSRLFAIFTTRYLEIIRKYFIVYIIDEEQKMIPFLPNMKAKEFLFWIREDCFSAEYLTDHLIINE